VSFVWHILVAQRASPKKVGVDRTVLADRALASKLALVGSITNLAVAETACSCAVARGRGGGLIEVLPASAPEGIRGAVVVAQAHSATTAAAVSAAYTAAAAALGFFDAYRAALRSSGE
jgi:hypothetical protein